MKNFPKNAKGEPNHIVVTKNGEFVAKLKVIKWGKAVASAAPAAVPVVAAKPKPVPTPEIADDDFAPVSAANSSAVIGDDGEFDLD